jgi:hypothetical protein
MTTANENPMASKEPVVARPDQPEAATALLRAENERLKERVQRLEEERERERQALAAVRAERDAYRRAAYAWAAGQVTDEDLRRYAAEEDGLPLDDFIGELEGGAKANKDA